MCKEGWVEVVEGGLVRVKSVVRESVTLRSTIMTVEVPMS